MEYIFALFLIALAAIDRFYFKRRSIDLQNVYHAGTDESSLKFALGFSISQKLKSSSLVYTLRDVKNPSTVIAGKPRTLDFSAIGASEEYLIFPKHLVKDGKWRLDVKAVSTGSSINPLYKIFPITSVMSREFDVMPPNKPRHKRKRHEH